jgi:hypothetical protein
MVMVMDEVSAVPAVFVARTVNVEAPAVVGVPDNNPPELNVSPDGSEPDCTANVGAGEPLAANVYEL